MIRIGEIGLLVVVKIVGGRAEIGMDSCVNCRVNFRFWVRMGIRIAH